MLAPRPTLRSREPPCYPNGGEVPNLTKGEVDDKEDGFACLSTERYQTMEDLFQNPDDSMEADPADLGPALTAVLTSTLAKRLASEHQKPWTDKQESAMQENISALVAAANVRGLKTIKVIVTRPNGQKASRELLVERISKTRSLQ